MPFSHYPKTVGNLVFAWVQPAPPAAPGFLGQRPFAEMNLFKDPIKVGASVVGYHDAQPFTRFYGSVASDQSLEITILFSNDEVAPDGHWVTDTNISELHYDAEALRQCYDPTKQGPTGKFFVTIYGRFIRVEIKNTGVAPTKELHAYVRGSVF